MFQVRAMRLTFVGELGWELHVPTESLSAVYDAVMGAGEEFGIADAGYRAIDALSSEKGNNCIGVHNLGTKLDQFLHFTYENL